METSFNSEKDFNLLGMLLAFSEIPTFSLQSTVYFNAQTTQEIPMFIVRSTACPMSYIVIHTCSTTYSKHVSGGLFHLTIDILTVKAPVFFLL